MDKINFTDNKDDADKYDIKTKLMFKIAKACYTLYDYTTGICISNIYIILANKAAFTKAFIASKHDYIMWSSNNGKKKRYTNKNEKEDAESRKKNSDDFSIED